MVVVSPGQAFDERFRDKPSRNRTPLSDSREQSEAVMVSYEGIR
jgi:hypothetical protein